jgi:hypothetical protein
MFISEPLTYNIEFHIPYMTVEGYYMSDKSVWHNVKVHVLSVRL